MHGCHLRGFARTALECCAGPVDFVKSYGMQYESENTLSGVSGVPRNFFRGVGFQQIQLRTEDRDEGGLGAVAP